MQRCYFVLLPMQSYCCTWPSSCLPCAALRWPRIWRLQLPVVLWAVGIELMGAICPLTYLENDLRMRAGQQGYSEGFIEHYLLPLMYPAGLTPAVQYILASVVLGVNLTLYAWLWLRRHQ
ncbi:DUF2784 domain-containing protein [Pseudoduganella sp. S-14]|uniref:DUF2784 domain-containing protein n=1 Tax=Pseudoduganella sp. S-14 TaxID=3404065 RepID=UPI003CE90C5C